MTVDAETLVRALRAAEVEAAALEGAVVAHVFPPPIGKRVRIEVEAVRVALAGHTTPRCALTAFARGVASVLLEPTRSQAATMAFADCARSVTPTLEGRAFAAGVAAAGGEPPFLIPFADGIDVAFSVELSEGVRTLTRAQVEAWGATGDRVAQAAKSILFHRSWGVKLTELPDNDTIWRFDANDGFDASRLLILDQLDYERWRGGLLFAVPTARDALISFETSTAAIERLRRAAADALNASPCPFDSTVYHLVPGSRPSIAVAPASS